MAGSEVPEKVKSAGSAAGSLRGRRPPRAVRFAAETKAGGALLYSEPRYPSPLFLFAKRCLSPITLPVTCPPRLSTSSPSTRCNSITSDCDVAPAVGSGAAVVGSLFRGSEGPSVYPNKQEFVSVNREGRGPSVGPVLVGIAFLRACLVELHEGRMYNGRMYKGRMYKGRMLRGADGTRRFLVSMVDYTSGFVIAI